jgi:hypothetical protein
MSYFFRYDQHRSPYIEEHNGSLDELLITIAVGVDEGYFHPIHIEDENGNIFLEGEELRDKVGDIIFKSYDDNDYK